jgi:hypothetical protein
MKRKGIKVSALVLAAITVASMTFTWAQAQPEDFRLPSPGFSPGHPLYGVELFVEENIEVPLARLTRGRLGEAEKRLRLSEERLAEIEAVCNRTDAAALERLRYRYELQMNKTLAMVNATDSPDLETWTAERAMNHVRVLTRIRARPGGGEARPRQRGPVQCQLVRHPHEEDGVQGPAGGERGWKRHRALRGHGESPGQSTGASHGVKQG